MEENEVIDVPSWALYFLGMLTGIGIVVIISCIDYFIKSPSPLK